MHSPCAIFLCHHEDVMQRLVPRRGSADRFQAEYLDATDPDLSKTGGRGVTLEALGGRLVSVESRSTYERVIKA